MTQQVILNNSLTCNSIIAYFNIISFYKNTLKETICLIKIQQAFSSAGAGLISPSFTQLSNRLQTHKLKKI